MSGGHWNYIQHQVRDASEDLRRMVRLAGRELPRDDHNRQWGDTHYRDWPEAVKQRFLEAAEALERAAWMMHEVDYLLCGDHGDDSFLEAWQQRLEGKR